MKKLLAVLLVLLMVVSLVPSFGVMAAVEAEGCTCDIVPVVPECAACPVCGRCVELDCIGTKCGTCTPCDGDALHPCGCGTAACSCGAAAACSGNVCPTCSKHFGCACTACALDTPNHCQYNGVHLTETPEYKLEVTSFTTTPKAGSKVTKGDVIKGSVTVKNTGTDPITVSTEGTSVPGVGYHYGEILNSGLCTDFDLSPTAATIIDPGKSKTFTFSAKVSGAPAPAGTDFGQLDKVFLRVGFFYYIDGVEDGYAFPDAKEFKYNRIIKNFNVYNTPPGGDSSTAIIDYPFSSFYDSGTKKLVTGAKVYNTRLKKDLTPNTDFTTEEGSTKITLKSKYMSSLPTGDTKIEVTFVNPLGDGANKTVTLVITKMGPKNAKKGAATKPNPVVGDEAIVFWAVVFVVALLGVTGLGIAAAKKGKKKSKSNETVNEEAIEAPESVPAIEESVVADVPSAEEAAGEAVEETGEEKTEE